MLIHKFASTALANFIEDTFASEHFSWFWNSSVTYSNEVHDAKNDFQFIHCLFRNGAITSEYFDVVRIIMHLFESKTGIDIKGIVRAKANLMTKSIWSEEDLNNSIHTDYENDNYVSLIYYVSDSDGDTVIYDNDRKTIVDTVAPIKGNLIYFKANQPHRPTPPSKHKRRIVINIVVEV